MGQILTEAAQVAIPDNRTTTPVALTYDEAACIELHFTKWVEAQEAQKFPAKPPQGTTLMVWMEAKAGREAALKALRILIKKMNEARERLIASSSEPAAS